MCACAPAAPSLSRSACTPRRAMPRDGTARHCRNSAHTRTPYAPRQRAARSEAAPAAARQRCRAKQQLKVSMAFRCRQHDRLRRSLQRRASCNGFALISITRKTCLAMYSRFCRSLRRACAKRRSEPKPQPKLVLGGPRAAGRGGYLGTLFLLGLCALLHVPKPHRTARPRSAAAALVQRCATCNS